VAERLSRLGVPLLLGLPLGHGRRNAAVPYGGVVTVDADAGVLEFHEGAVASR
jgi:muramoyltetrapeptide carboxypeptidase